MIEYRELTEIEKQQVPGLLKGQTVVGAVEDETVLAACGLISVVHLDPVWVHPSKRRSMFLLRRLWEATKRHLAGLGVPVVTGSIIEGMPEPPLDVVVERLILRLAGGKELHGRFFMMPIKK